jgi:hypothetical protein
MMPILWWQIAVSPTHALINYVACITFLISYSLYPFSDFVVLNVQVKASVIAEYQVY